MAARMPVRVRTSVAVAVVAAEFVAGVIAIVIVSTSSSASSSGGSHGTPSVRPSHSRTGGSSPAAQLDAQTAQLVSWVQRSLPPSTPLLSDAAVAAKLRGAGFTAVHTPDGGKATARFVVSTPKLRAGARDRPEVARALAASVPVAVIGTGDAAVSVRQIATITSAQLAEDASNRRSADPELLANPQIRASAQAAQILRDGELDYRAASVLVSIAGYVPVELLDIQVDAAEKAAGRPARIIDIRVTSVPMARSVIAQVATGFRLASVTVRPGGELRLTWPVDVTSGGSN